MGKRGDERERERGGENKSDRLAETNKPGILAMLVWHFYEQVYRVNIYKSVSKSAVKNVEALFLKYEGSFRTPLTQ